MIRLKLLGGAVLEDESDRLGGAAAHRHSLALMALLARAPSGTLSRGKVVGSLWPGVLEKTARNRLNTCLHRLRSQLGADVIVSEGKDIRLNHGRVSCDVAGFQEALERGALKEAVEQYRGPFLDGFWIPDSPEFDQWMDGERARLASRYQEALESLAEAAHARGNPKKAARWWRELARERPLDSSVTLCLMEALESVGMRAPALRAAEGHAAQLEEELGTRPSAAVQARARRLREEAARGRAASTPAAMADDLDPRTVAVLPFEDLGSEEGGELFASGLHQDLLTRLSRSDELRVISRTSVRQYAGVTKPVRETARELGAGTVVEGGLQRIGERVRLNVQLIDGRTDEHRWAEIYDRQVTADNLFEIQSDLVERIAGSLKAELVPGVGSMEQKEPPTRSLEAYRLQVQGRSRLDERTRESMRQAMRHFRAALEADPEYPHAWIGLADALTVLHLYGYADERGQASLSEAEAAARRALELDPEMGEAHASLGLLHEARCRGPAAVAAYRRAVALNPSYADAHSWLSWTYQLLGRAEKALAASRQAVELSPLSLEVVGNLAMTQLYSGDPVTALREIRRVRELEPEESSAIFSEALILHRLGRISEAKDRLRGLSVPWTGSGPRSTLAVLEAESGEVEPARVALAGFESEGDHFAAGVVRAAMGDGDGALDALERMRDWGFWPTLVMHYHFPRVLAPLRADPRFGGIMERVHESWGLEPDGSFPEVE